MRVNRFVLPACVIVMLLAAVSWSGAEHARGGGGKLIDVFQVGDFVTLGSRTVANPSHVVTVLTEEEVSSIRKRLEEHEEKRAEYGEKVAMLRELVESAGEDRALRGGMLNRQRDFMRQVRRPTRPSTLYEVLTVGEDYVGVLSEGSDTELLINACSIREVRRKVGEG